MVGMIELAQSTPSDCLTQIRFGDRLKTTTNGRVDLKLTWEKREGNWWFQPVIRQGINQR